MARTPAEAARSPAWPIEVGTELPALHLAETSLDDMVRWAAATEDFTPFHYDPEAARARGFPGAVVNGPLKAALLAEQLLRTLGPGATVSRIACRYRRPDFVGDALVCRARVTSLAETVGGTLVSCEVWIENGAGESTTTGTADVLVPRREDAVAGDASRPLITDEMRERYAAGRAEWRFTYRVTVEMIDRFAEALGDEDPRWRESGDPAGGRRAVIAPPTLVAALDPFERKDIPSDGVVEMIPYAPVGGGNAFSEVEYIRPVVAGDMLTVVFRHSDLYEREGRGGRLLFRVRETEILDSQGELVARTRAGHVMAYDTTRMADS